LAYSRSLIVEVEPHRGLLNQVGDVIMSAGGSRSSRILQHPNAQFVGNPTAALAYRALHAHFMRRLALAINQWEGELMLKERRKRPPATVKAEVLLDQAELLWMEMNTKAKHAKRRRSGRQEDKPQVEEASADGHRPRGRGRGKR